MVVEKIKAKGSLHIVLKDAAGNVKQDILEDNLVVATGLSLIASRMKDATSAVTSHMALGTSSTAPSKAQTGLLGEVGRVALASTNLVQTTTANDSIEYVATFGAGVATGAITEAGLFNSPSGGSMVSRTTFNVVNKDANDSITITWKLVFI